jgi:hypothetical protein
MFLHPWIQRPVFFSSCQRYLPSVAILQVVPCDSRSSSKLPVERALPQARRALHTTNKSTEAAPSPMRKWKQVFRKSFLRHDILVRNIVDCSTVLTSIRACSQSIVETSYFENRSQKKPYQGNKYILTCSLSHLQFSHIRPLYI